MKLTPPEDGAGALGESSDVGQDLVRRFGPNEGPGIFVVHVDVLADGGFQLFHASQHATSNALVGDGGEPAFHQVNPGTIGGGKVNMKAWTLRKPFADDRRFVGAVVIDDEMRLQIRRARWASITSRNWRNSEERWRRCSWPITRLVFNSNAANRDVVPWRS